jgi:GNAT superfamily N-acetyltransferase
MTDNAMPHHAHVRRLLPLDREQLGQHLQRLDDESRHLRFGSAVSDSFLKNHADSLYRFDTLIYGHFEDDCLRGIGELRSVKFDKQALAEIAFSVEKQHRNKGIGSLLMDRIVTAARNRGFAHLTVFCVPGNEPMRHLANKFGARMHAMHGEVEGDIMPDPATPFTLIGEAVQEAHGLVSAFWDQAGRWTEGTHR